VHSQRHFYLAIGKELYFLWVSGKSIRSLSLQISVGSSSASLLRVDRLREIEWDWLRGVFVLSFVAGIRSSTISWDNWWELPWTFQPELHCWGKSGSRIDRALQKLSSQ
jgi:hypothetical protein